MKINFKPRGGLALVERIKQEEITSGIIVPDNDGFILRKFKIINVGPEVLDLKEGDTVLAEDALQLITKASKDLGLLHQKYIHLIYGK